MKKNRLLTPGPTQIPEAVLASMAKPILHHRTPAFKSIMESVSQKLKTIFQTKNDVLLLLLIVRFLLFEIHIGEAACFPAF